MYVTSTPQSPKNFSPKHLTSPLPTDPSAQMKGKSFFSPSNPCYFPMIAPGRKNLLPADLT